MTSFDQKYPGGQRIQSAAGAAPPSVLTVRERQAGRFVHSGKQRRPMFHLRVTPC
jgi:hypothetical protein